MLPSRAVNNYCMYIILNVNKIPYILEEFLSQLLTYIGFSNEDLSEIKISVDITKGDVMDKKKGKNII